jgi:hypothetical protein
MFNHHFVAICVVAMLAGALAIMPTHAKIIKESELDFSNDAGGKILKRNSPNIEKYGFAPHELPFEKKADSAENDKKIVSSEPFFAIILRRGKRCSFTEKARQTIQKLIGFNKVFFENYKCEDNANQQYTNLDSEYSYLLIYGGKTREEARALYERERLKYTFPGSRIMRMRAFIEE